MSASYRLQWELRSLWEDPLPNVCVHATGVLDHWDVTIKGPVDTPYEGGAWCLELVFPRDYPFKAPVCSFRTPIHHCNLSSFVAPNQRSVESLLQADEPGWRPGLFVRDVLNKILSAMVEPIRFPDPPLGLHASGGQHVGPCTPGGMHILVKTLTGLALETHRELQEYDIVQGSAVHMAHSCMRKAKAVDRELQAQFDADRASYESTAREWTRRFALDPELGPVITAHVNPSQSGVSCVGLSGNEVCAVRGGEALQSCKVAGLRLSLAARLDVPPAAVRLVLASGRCLQPDDDSLSLADVLISGGTAVAAS